jgi:hypothetical protein
MATAINDARFGRAAVVKVSRLQRERRFPPGPAIDVIKARRATTRAELTEEQLDLGNGKRPHVVDECCGKSSMSTRAISARAPTGCREVGRRRKALAWRTADDVVKN